MSFAGNYPPFTLVDGKVLVAITGSGSGDFSGPASATDNVFVRFNGTTGKLGQNSQTVEDDSGNVAVAGTLTSTGTLINSAGRKGKTRVVTAAGAATLTSADYIVILNKTVGAATVVNLPAGVTNTIFIIKDGKGDAAANNITVTPAAGNIDGSGTYVISANYGVVRLVYNGTSWSTI